MVNIKKKNSLTPLKNNNLLISKIEKINWVAIEAYRGIGNKLDSNCIAVAFNKSKKTLEYADKVLVRFGAHVMKKMKWDYGIKILPMYDPDDYFSFLLVKSDNDIGYKLGKETGSDVGTMSFRWDRDIIKIKQMASKIVEHQMEKQYIHFRIDQ
jgi:hypothetical protein